MSDENVRDCSTTVIDTIFWVLLGSMVVPVPVHTDHRGFGRLESSPFIEHPVFLKLVQGVL